MSHDVAHAQHAPDASRGRTIRRLALVLLVVGALVSLPAFLSEDGRARVGSGYLLGFTFVWSIVLGSLFFVGLQHITRSVWSVVLRRVGEMLSAPMWLIALLFVPLVAFALLHDSFGVFSWLDPDKVKIDPLLQHKAPYLDATFFVIRGVAFFLIWVLFARAFVRGSLRQDDGADGGDTSRGTQRMRSLSAPFLLIFGLTATFAAFDWLMSTDPHWFSTIYGVYVFSGMTVASLAAITLGVVYFRKQGWIGDGLVKSDHLYSLGALMFAFTCFWAYIAFSQYMLIWYANIPEETLFFAHRLDHGWGAVTGAVALLRFVVPFFLLLGRPSKSDPKRLVLVSLLILAGQLLDLYWLIMPQVHAHGPVLGWAEIGPSVLLTGVLLLAVARFAGRHRLVAVGDPLLDKSREFHL